MKQGDNNTECEAEKTEENAAKAVKIDGETDNEIAEAGYTTEEGDATEPAEEAPNSEDTTTKETAATKPVEEAADTEKDASKTAEEEAGKETVAKKKSQEDDETEALGQYQL